MALSHPHSNVLTTAPGRTDVVCRDFTRFASLLGGIIDLRRIRENLLLTSLLLISLIGN